VHSHYLLLAITLLKTNLIVYIYVYTHTHTHTHTHENKKTCITTLNAVLSLSTKSKCQINSKRNDYHREAKLDIYQYEPQEVNKGICQKENYSIYTNNNLYRCIYIFTYIWKAYICLRNGYSGRK
jgi:hypothetical protein